jgi:hypothetical protein
MFQLNCHHQWVNTYIAKTYSNKVVLLCLHISYVQIIVKMYSGLTVIKLQYYVLLIVTYYKVMAVFIIL